MMCVYSCSLLLSRVWPVSLLIATVSPVDSTQRSRQVLAEGTTIKPLSKECQLRGLKNASTIPIVIRCRPEL